MDEYTFTQLDALDRAYQEPAHRPAHDNGHHAYDNYTHDYQHSNDYYSVPEDEYLHGPQELDAFGKLQSEDRQPVLTREQMNSYFTSPTTTPDMLKRRLVERGCPCHQHTFSREYLVTAK